MEFKNRMKEEFDLIRKSIRKDAAKIDELTEKMKELEAKREELNWKLEADVDDSTLTSTYKQVKKINEQIAELEHFKTVLTKKRIELAKSKGLVNAIAKVYEQIKAESLDANRELREVEIRLDAERKAFEEKQAIERAKANERTANIFYINQSFGTLIKPVIQSFENLYNIRIDSSDFTADIYDIVEAKIQREKEEDERRARDLYETDCLISEDDKFIQVDRWVR